MERLFTIFGKLRAIALNSLQDEVAHTYQVRCLASTQENKFEAITVTDMNEEVLNAITQGNLAALGELLDSPLIDINRIGENGQTFLFAAIDSMSPNRFETLHLLLKKGALLEIRNINGWSALHYVIRLGDSLVFELLLPFAKDLEIKTTSDYHSTPLLDAVRLDESEIAKTLIEVGADTTQKDFYGNDSLACALKNGNVVIADLLSTITKTKSEADSTR